MPVKTIPKNRFKTIDEAVIFLTESTAKSEADFRKLIAESDAKMAESMAKSEADFRKSIAESDARIAAANAKIAESDTRIAAANAKIAESQAKTDLAIQRLTENVDRLSLRVEEVLTGFSTVGNRFGELVEFLVAPGLRRVINKYNHDFKRSTSNKKFYYIGRDGFKHELTEVDMFLSNGTEVMAVEVKATLSAGYVSKHLLRLKKLREFEKEINLQGKKIYGAVVGIYIEKDARKLALKNGLYVIDILEDEKKLNVSKPTQCRVW
jgi:predicted RecB family endonuclease